MRRIFFCLGVLIACFVNVGNVANAQKDYDQMWEERQAEGEAALEEFYRQRDEYLEYMENLKKKNEAIVKEQEAQLKKSAEQLLRYDAILQTWENQQKQYQKYLDNLPQR